MTEYTYHKSRNRLTQRLSPAEAVSRSFDHKTNAIVTHGARATPEYDTSLSLDCVGGGGGNAESAEFSALSANSSISLYAKATAGGWAVCTVKLYAKTSLGDYVEVFKDSAFAPLTEYRVFTRYRNVKAELTMGANESGTLYLGGE